MAEEPNPRLKLAWDALVFQLKLAVDGIRDVILIPISIVAAIFGLLTSAEEPDRYFQKVLRFGRQSEVWINLFGYRKHAATSDSMLKPLEEKVLETAQTNPLARKAGASIDRSIDRINERVNRPDDE